MKLSTREARSKAYYAHIVRGVRQGFVPLTLEQFNTLADKIETTPSGEFVLLVKGSKEREYAEKNAIPGVLMYFVGTGPYVTKENYETIKTSLDKKPN